MMVESSRDKNECAYRSGEGGEGHACGDPGSELRQQQLLTAGKEGGGEREKEREKD